MPAIPLLNGIIGSEAGEFRQSYPRNLEPVPVDSKLAKGQLRMAMGATEYALGPGIDRGGIVWNNEHFRVMGTKFVRVDQSGEIQVLGDVGGAGPVTMDYSFSYLAIRSGAALYYWSGETLSQVTDEDLGAVLDLIWVDGFFMVTDGTYTIVTELSDPFQVLPAKYGSAESDPDMVTGLLKLRGEVYVLGRHTIEVHQNVGGSGYPFARIDGATIPYGCVSASAKAMFGESFAFIGSARGEALSVYLAGQGTAQKIGTRRIDDELANEVDPSAIVLENRTSRDEARLYVHLRDRTWVYMAGASVTAREPVWYEVGSGESGAYRIRNATPVGNSVICGDLSSNRLGLVTQAAASHFGVATPWRFDVGLLPEPGRGVVLDSVELYGLPGRGGDGRAFFSYSRDGELFSMERAVSTGRLGERTRRVQWRPRIRVQQYLALRFRGTGDAMPGIAACNVELS